MGRFFSGRFVLTIVSSMVVFSLIGAGSTKASAKTDYSTDFYYQESTSTVDADKALEDFMHSKSTSKTGAKVRNVKRRVHLSTANAIIYDALKEAATKIANGERDNAQVTVTIPVKEIMGSDWKESYTPSDFGLTSFVDYKGEFTREASTAINEKLGINSLMVMNALVADYPYLCYWYGNGISSSSVGVMMDSDYSSIRLEETSNATFGMVVSSDYSKTGAKNTTDVNVSKCKAVVSAATKASEIVKENASKDDYDKLKAYHDAICALTSYNHDAASSSSSVPYGNPWQLIYVFDGNPSTKVVCEGYSKAFKYLCDESKFNSSLVECFIITGDLRYGSTSGPHMWNNVRMDDGKTYLVDVTNDDSDSGVIYLLFLAGLTKSGGDKLVTEKGVSYCYDSRTKNIYKASELEVSTTNYVKSSSTTEKTIHITKYLNDGTDTSEIIDMIAGNSLPSLKVAPTRSGYVFDGWYDAKSGGNKVTEETIFNDDTILYAHWTKEEETTSGGDKDKDGDGDVDTDELNSGSDKDGDNKDSGNNDDKSKSGNDDDKSKSGNNNDQSKPGSNKDNHPKPSTNGSDQQNSGNNDSNNNSGSGNTSNVAPEQKNTSDGSTSITGGKRKISKSELPPEGSLTSGGTDYHVDEEGNASVSKAADKKIKKLTIKDIISYNGNSFKITIIGSSAYKNCKKLVSVTIGSNVTKIGKNAFYGCSSLKKITLKADNLKTVGSGSFKGIKKGATIVIVCKDRTSYNKLVKKIKKAGAKSAKFKFKKS